MNKKVDSGAVDEIDFVKAFEQILIIKLVPGKDTKESIESIKVGLRSNVWEKRVEHLKRVSGVVKGFEECENIVTLVRTLENELHSCIIDLRSQIVREACICVAYLSVRLGLRFEAAVEPLAIALMSIVPNSIRVISSSGKVALKFIYQNTHSKRLVTVLSHILSYSKSVAQRQFSCELLCVICVKWTSKRIDQSMTVIGEALKKAVCDSDIEARTHGKLAFLTFHGRFMAQAEMMLKCIEPSRRSQLQKELNAVAADKDSLVASSKIVPSKVAKTKKLSPPCNVDFFISQNATNESILSSIVDPLPLPPLFEQVMLQLNSRLNKDKMEGLETMREWIDSSDLNDGQRQSLMDCFNIYFLENDSDVRLGFLATLSSFIKRFFDWIGSSQIESLLLKLLNLKTSPHRNDCIGQVDVIVTIISSRCPDHFLRHCLQIVTREGLNCTAALSLCLCDIIMHSLTKAVFDVPATTMSALVSVLLSWIGDTRYPQLKKVSHDILLRLAHIDKDSLRAVVATLPHHLQVRVCVNIDYNNSPSKIPTTPRRSYPGLCDDLARSRMHLAMSPLVETKCTENGPPSVMVNTNGRSVLTQCDLNRSQSLRDRDCPATVSTISDHLVHDTHNPPMAHTHNPTMAHTHNPSMAHSATNTVISHVHTPKMRGTVYGTHNHGHSVLALVSTDLKDPSPRPSPPRVVTVTSTGMTQLIHKLNNADDINTLCKLLSDLSIDLKSLSSSSSSLSLIEDHLVDVCSVLTKLVSHDQSGRVRRFTILALVDLYALINDRMWCWITMDTVKKNIFDFYVAKSKEGQKENNY